MTFDFISDDKFRDILRRDFEELNKCVEIKASKSVLILSGSIIEAILTDYFINFPPEDKSKKKILQMDLYGLIELGKEKNLISQSTKELATVLKNYRNLIHPGREIRKSVSFDYDTAIVAKSLLNIILKEIRENYLNNLGYSATDILQKLENDSVSQPIYEKILNKLNKNEKTKLYNKLIEYDLSDSLSGNRLKNPKKYIRTLKSQINREAVEKQLKKLVYIIETGQKWEAMSYYFLLYEDLNYLQDDEVELILLYVLNALSESTGHPDDFNGYVNQNLFSTFGTYIKAEPVRKEFQKLACELVTNIVKRDYMYYDAYDQLVNSVNTDEKNRIKEYVVNNTSSYRHENFYKGYDDGNYLSF